MFAVQMKRTFFNAFSLLQILAARFFSGASFLLRALYEQRRNRQLYEVPNNLLEAFRLRGSLCGFDRGCFSRPVLYADSVGIAF
jgi:hypothetical protein